MKQWRQVRLQSVPATWNQTVSRPRQGTSGAAESSGMSALAGAGEGLGEPVDAALKGVPLIPEPLVVLLLVVRELLVDAAGLLVGSACGQLPVIGDCFQLVLHRQLQRLDRGRVAGRDGKMTGVGLPRLVAEALPREGAVALLQELPVPDLLVGEVPVLLLPRGVLDGGCHLQVIVVRGLLVIDRFLDDLEGARGDRDHGAQPTTENWERQRQRPGGMPHACAASVRDRK